MIIDDIEIKKGMYTLTNLIQPILRKYHKQSTFRARYKVQ